MQYISVKEFLQSNIILNIIIYFRFLFFFITYQTNKLTYNLKFKDSNDL